MSDELIEPFAFTSLRKFADVTGWPEFALMAPMSEVLTVRFHWCAQQASHRHDQFPPPFTQ
jgi:hypothetical protein